MIIVQELMSSWGKDLRSNGAVRRTIPEVLPVLANEENGLGALTVLHHCVSFLGEDGFIPTNAKSQTEESDTPILFHSGAIMIRMHRDSPNSISIKLKWSVEVGAPQRADRHILNLEKGQWAQVIYNGRSAISGSLHTDWRYLQRTTNIAFTDQLDANVFTATKPILRFEDLADLR